MKKLVLSIAILVFLISYASAGEKKPGKPAPRDKCPVCGMFVEKYPDFLAQIVFKDGSYAMFDGPKDMFKCFLNMKKYIPSKRESDIDFVYVTDYYRLVSVDGFKAYYVMGSDVYGPMGRELIPFEKEADAREFMKDHKGQSITAFKDMTDAALKAME